MMKHRGFDAISRRSFNLVLRLQSSRGPVNASEHLSGPWSAPTRINIAWILGQPCRFWANFWYNATSFVSPHCLGWSWWRINNQLLLHPLPDTAWSQVCAFFYAEWPGTRGEEEHFCNAATGRLLQSLLCTIKVQWKNEPAGGDAKWFGWDEEQGFKVLVARAMGGKLVCKVKSVRVCFLPLICCLSLV